MCQIRRRPKVLIKQAIKKQVCRGKEWPAECGWVIVVADCDIIAPHQQAKRGGVVLHPGIVEAQNRIEMRLQPIRVSALIAGEQSELTENRLGLISRGLVLGHDSEGVRAV